MSSAPDRPGGPEPFVMEVSPEHLAHVKDTGRFTHTERLPFGTCIMLYTREGEFECSDIAATRKSRSKEGTGYVHTLRPRLSALWYLQKSVKALIRHLTSGDHGTTENQ